MKAKLLSLYLVLLALPLLALPSSALGQDTRAAVEAGSQAWQTAWNAGDAAGMAALYASDAMVLAPGFEPVTGPEAIQAFWQTSIGAQSGGSGTLTTMEVHEMGDMAVEVGSYANTGSDGQHVDHGKYLVVWKKVDGEWKILRDIFNSSM